MGYIPMRMAAPLVVAALCGALCVGVDARLRTSRLHDAAGGWNVAAALNRHKIHKKRTKASSNARALSTKAAGSSKPGTGPKVWAELYTQEDCKGLSLRTDPSHNEAKCDQCFDSCIKKYKDGSPVAGNVRSVRIFVEEGKTMPKKWSVSLNQNCAGAYGYSEDAIKKGLIKTDIRAEDGCVNTQHPDTNLLQWEGLPSEDEFYTPQSYRFLYSAESSTYFAYQAYANLLAFHKSEQQQDPPTGYIRLLTASKSDDLATENGGKIPTFTASRDPYSRQYSPFNKADAVAKYMDKSKPWYPKEEVMVIIDPDNWLVSTVAHVAAKVKPGHAVAAAAFFNNNPLVTELFQKLVCEKACDVVPDTVAVPYFVHREDLRKIAPLWKILTKKVRTLFQDPSIASKYKPLQPEWCAEMYGYIYAAAELRIKHSIKARLQIRDVDGKISWDMWNKRKIGMIHMGRAWFPRDYAENLKGGRWIHTEGGKGGGLDLRPGGTEQVWCKCNYTAGVEVPWPLPPKVDFVSNVTLTLLHDAFEKYGNPCNDKNEFRKGSKTHSMYSYSIE